MTLGAEDAITQWCRSGVKEEVEVLQSVGAECRGRGRPTLRVSERTKLSIRFSIWASATRARDKPMNVLRQ